MRGNMTNVAVTTGIERYRGQKKGRKCDTGDRKPDRNPMTRQTVGRNAEREWQPSKERINKKYRQVMEMDNGVQAENSFAV